MLAGVTGGAASYLAGIILVAMIPETTLVGAIAVGVGSGSAGGGVMQVTANAVTGRALDEGLWVAVVSGGVTGGVGGTLGFGPTRAWGALKNKALLRPINRQGVPYPKVHVEGYGEVPFPKGPFKPHEPETFTRLRNDFRSSISKEFQIWWTETKGIPWPIRGQAHHIKPLSRGGTNVFENLVPLQSIPGEDNIHNLFTQWWNHFP